MIRLSVGAVVCAIAACAASKPPPAATATTQPAMWWEVPKMPLGTDLDAVPVGSWAEYELRAIGFTNTNRVAGVAKTADAITIESMSTGGLLRSDQIKMAHTFGLGSNHGRYLRYVFQVNSAAPKESPTTSPPYPRLDPQALVGTETVTVRAGTFTTRHYRYKTSNGDAVDAWIDETVWPIGLVRLEAKVQLRPAPDATSREATIPSSTRPATFVYELIARGDGAEPRIAPPGGPSP